MQWHGKSQHSESAIRLIRYQCCLWYCAASFGFNSCLQCVMRYVESFIFLDISFIFYLTILNCFNIKMSIQLTRSAEVNKEKDTASKAVRSVISVLLSGARAVLLCKRRRRVSSAIQVWIQRLRLRINQSTKVWTIPPRRCASRSDRYTQEFGDGH